MLYILQDNEIKKTQIENVNADVISIGFLSMEQLAQHQDKLGIQMNVIVEYIKDQTHLRSNVDVYREFSFGIINIVNVLNLHEPKDRIAFIIKKNQFILVKLKDEDDSCKEMFEHAITRFQQSATLGKIIFGILESLLLNGNKPLEVIETKIIRMEQKLVNNDINEHLNRDIFQLRKDLSVLKNYYEQLVDIGEDLLENKNNLLLEEDLRYFSIFIAKAERLSHNTQLLSEDLIHVREALDASLNYSLNKVMKFFTVVTTIFLPLTLLVGWYGMNFTNMPELTWKYGYVTVIVVSILMIIISMYLFKKKKYF